LSNRASVPKSVASRPASGAALHPGRSVEERRGPGDQQVQAGEPAGVHLVDQLAQGVEGLVPDVAPHPLQGLDLVEHEHQPGVPGVTQHGEQSLQERHRPEGVELPADPGRAFGRRRHLRLPAHPGGQAVGERAVPGTPAAATGRLVTCRDRDGRKAGPRVSTDRPDS
jgi:hypothetical protein